MIKTKEQIIKEYPVEKTCDKCGKTFTLDDDILEFQEFHHIRFTGGYGSVFGDGSEVECDICQYCLLEMIKDIFRIKEDFPF